MTCQDMPSSGIATRRMRPVHGMGVFPTISFHGISRGACVCSFKRGVSNIAYVRISNRQKARIEVGRNRHLRPGNHLSLSGVSICFQNSGRGSPFRASVLVLDKRRSRFVPQFGCGKFHCIRMITSGPVRLSRGDLVTCFVRDSIPTMNDLRSSDPLVNGLLRTTGRSCLSGLVNCPASYPRHRGGN